MGSYHLLLNRLICFSGVEGRNFMSAILTNNSKRALQRKLDYCQAIRVTFSLINNSNEKLNKPVFTQEALQDTKEFFLGIMFTIFS